MAPNADPWRTLGLAPGATQDEIRRAYRRLAKVNHPDAAGDAALPRFLAIQAAYEQLAGPGRVRRVGARPPARPTEPTSSREPREPWRADPDRARASGRADGRRTPGARPGAAGPRAGRGGEPGEAAGPNAGAAGPGPGPRDDGAGDGRDAPGAGPAGGSASSARSRRASGRRRPANTATPGSTSYEGADEEPFEPGWTGATWYGASSGTYWTINPKEYADPRKHGPEYQARARRAREGWILDDATEGGTAPAGPVEQPAGGAPIAEAAAGEPASVRADDPMSARADDPAATAARDAPGSAGPGRAGSAGRDPAVPTDGPFVAGRSIRRPGGRRHWTDGRPAADATRADAADPDLGAAWAPGAGTGRPPGDAAGAGGWSGSSTGPSSAGPSSTAASPSTAPSSGGRPSGGLGTWIERPAGDAGFRGPLLRQPTTQMGRLLVAILGWPPLGVFAAAAIDASTGCGSYAASCPEVYSPGTWIVQVAIVLFLLALPTVAAWSAHGSIAALVVGVPSAIVLSAAGGTNVREASAPILLVVLAVAYLGGVGYAIVARRSTGSA